MGISRDLYQLFVWDLAAVARSLKTLGADREFPVLGAWDEAAAPQLSLRVLLPDERERTVAELTECESALQATPREPMLQLRHGRLLRQLERDCEAREALAGAVERDAPVEASIELAECEIRLQHWTQGLAVLEKALTRDTLSRKDAANLSNEIAWHLSLAPPEGRSPATAVEYAHRALQLEPANLNYLNTLGFALFRRGELPSAIETLKLSLHGSSLPALDLYLLALCHQRAGDGQRAQDCADQAEYLFETHGETWRRQVRLELLQFRQEFERGKDQLRD